MSTKLVIFQVVFISLVVAAASWFYFRDIPINGTALLTGSTYSLNGWDTNRQVNIDKNTRFIVTEVAGYPAAFFINLKDNHKIDAFAMAVASCSTSTSSRLEKEVVAELFPSKPNFDYTVWDGSTSNKFKGVWIASGDKISAEAGLRLLKAKIDGFRASRMSGSRLEFANAQFNKASSEILDSIVGCISSDVLNEAKAAGVAESKK